MGMAETAVLAVDLKLNGVSSYTSGMSQVHAANAKAASGVGGFTGGLKNAEKGLQSFGTHLGHAKSAIGGLLTGPIGILGLSAGIFTLGGAIQQGISRAIDFGAEVRRLKALTGESTEAMSLLAAGLEHFGVSADTAIRAVGFLEKNVGLLAAKKDGLKKFQETFGLALTDTNGKVKTANELIKTITDYYTNKHIPTTEKAAAMSKLFGRSWQELIPFLSAGKKGIVEAEREAARLGLTLKDADMKSLIAMRDATREWNTALGGLELQIGLALIPSLTNLARTATTFVRDNRVGIVQFFKDAAANVGKFGDFIRKDVIPPLQMFGTAAKRAWDTVPDPLKQILIGGVIANKTSKFLFDFGLKDAAGLLGKGIGGLGGLLGRGSTPANPLFVSMAGGVAGGPGGGIGGKIAGALLITGVVALAAESEMAIIQGFADANNRLADQGLTPAQIAALKYAQGSDDYRTAAEKHGYGQGTPGNPFTTFGPTGGGMAASRGGFTSHAVAALGQFTAAVRHAAIVTERDWIRHVGGLAGVMARSRAITGHDPTRAQAEAIYNRDLLHQLKVITEKSKASSDVKLERLKVLAQDAKDHGDIKTAAKIQAAIDRMKADLKAAATATTTSVNAAASTIAGAIANSDRNAYITVKVAVSANDLVKATTTRKRYYDGPVP